MGPDTLVSGHGTPWTPSARLRPWETDPWLDTLPCFGPRRAAGKFYVTHRPELFPNMTADAVHEGEDETAGALGAPFTEVEDEEELRGWVDWAVVDTETADAGSSAS